jgi:hypothetical protein
MMSRNLLLFVFISMLLSSSLLSSTDALGWVWTKAASPPMVSKSSPPSSSLPPTVSGHVAAASSSTTLPSGGHLLLFGGLTGPAGSPVTNDLYEYVVDDGVMVGGSWVQVMPPRVTRGPEDDATATTPEEEGYSSLWPRKRMYSAGAILGDNAFYLFGGWDPGAPGSGGTFLNDVWRFDLSTSRCSWKKLHDLPYAVSRHGACAINDEMIVSHTYQGVLVFRKRPTPAGGDDGTSNKSDCMTMTVQETTGDDRPDGLSMCAQVALGNRYAFIFGGSTRTQQLSDASYLLDTVTWKWTRLKTVPDENDNAGTAPLAPSARASPCGSAVRGSRDHQVIVFGGASLGGEGYAGGQGLVPLNDTWLATVNVEAGTLAWQRIAATTDTGRCPEARLAATLNCIPGKPRTLLLQGGYDSTAKRTFRESWILSFD